MLEWGLQYHFTSNGQIFNNSALRPTGHPEDFVVHTNWSPAGKIFSRKQLVMWAFNEDIAKAATTPKGTVPTYNKMVKIKQKDEQEEEAVV